MSVMSDARYLALVGLVAVGTAGVIAACEIPVLAVRIATDFAIILSTSFGALLLGRPKRATK